MKRLFQIGCCVGSWGRCWGDSVATNVSDSLSAAYLERTQARSHSHTAPGHPTRQPSHTHRTDSTTCGKYSLCTRPHSPMNTYREWWRCDDCCLLRLIWRAPFEQSRGTLRHVPLRCARTSSARGAAGVSGVECALLDGGLHLDGLVHTLCVHPLQLSLLTTTRHNQCTPA